MTPEAMIVQTALFWTLAVLCVSLPPRYGVVLYVLVIQFDLTGLAFYADSSFGWENAVKVAAIPIILLVRMRPLDRLPPGFNYARNFWMIFVLYAGIAVVWSPYPLSAVKMMGYFYSYVAAFAIFVHAWRRRWLTRNSLIAIASISLIFAVIQTYMLGNSFGDPEYDNRFTTFSGAQSFSPFLICMIILLTLSVKRTIGTWIVTGAAVIGFVLTGSRSNLVGFAWVALIIGLTIANRGRRKLTVGTIAKGMALCGVVFALVVSLVAMALPKNRLNEFLDLAATRNASLDDVRTFAWRLTLWSKTIEEISSRTPRQLIIGSGTSSGAIIGLETGYFQEADLDPNRTIHDEFLRVLYEWGVIGFVAFVGFLFALYRFSFKLARLTQSTRAWACVATLGPLIIGLLIENILGSGASPGGIGYCLVFAALVAQLRPARAKEKKPRRLPVKAPIGLSPSET